MFCSTRLLHADRQTLASRALPAPSSISCFGPALRHRNVGRSYPCWTEVDTREAAGHSFIRVTMKHPTRSRGVTSVLPRLPHFTQGGRVHADVSPDVSLTDVQDEHLEDQRERNDGTIPTCPRRHMVLALTNKTN